ncbi:hypothetical protein [Clostridium perfringens]|uniref:hypothetical protein n=1 Tax=Clostridium perfringens TaxID=1502 RepID=UPI0022473F30|nr:hypothetical protein [Clostridium perfringens]EJT5920845.1 hypothetical protein [Clostridium perfringens]EJT5920955.1 hypothetical protein [Clostridium perfringens]MCX0403352.1 hypothetical protein [Clostridium perfringens]MDM0947481.1 hypothetical protein [Clostridium perfringens]
MDDNNLIAVVKAAEELGVSRVSIDNNIKRKNIEKKYIGRTAYITKEEFKAIEQSMQNNGKLKRIKIMDSIEKELESIKMEKEVLVKELSSVNQELESSLFELDKIKEQKENLIERLEESKKNLDNTQLLLAREQELHMKSQNRILNLENELKQTKLQLTQGVDENAKLRENVKELEVKLETERNLSTERIEKQTSKLDEITKKKIEAEIAIEGYRSELEQERKAKEVLIEKQNLKPLEHIKLGLKGLFKR